MPAFTHFDLRLLNPAFDSPLVDVLTVSQLRAARRVGRAAKGLSGAMPKLNATQRTYQVRKLIERKLLQPIAPNSRQYTLGFDNNYLIRGVIHALAQEGFISAPLQG